MKSTGKATQLVYSLENGDEYSKRTNEKEEIRETQAFTNIDLYWMYRQGFVFDVVGGFSFETSMIYNLFIGPLSTILRKPFLLLGSTTHLKTETLANPLSVQLSMKLLAETKD